MPHSHHCSIWMDTHEPRRFAALPGSADTDVVVIGAGITGLTTALLLKRSGRRVMVLEAAHLGHGTSGWTTAHLATYPDAGFAAIERRFDRETARLVGRSLRSAVDRIEALAAASSLASHFERLDGWLWAASAEDREELEHEAEAATRADVPCELGEPPLPLAAHGGLRFPDQGRCHALAYLEALAREVENDGSRVHEQTRVLEVEAGEPCRVRTERGTVVAPDVVLATHIPLGFNPIQAELTPYQSYALAVQLDGELADALFWDTDEPYHYVRQGPAVDGHPTVIVGGADHRTAHDDEAEALRALRDWTAHHFRVAREVAHWSAKLYVPADGLPLIGHSPTAGGRVWVATGYSGDGLTFGTAAAEILHDLILGRTSPLAEIYRPGRISLAAVPRFVEQSLDTAKRLVRDRFGGAEPAVVAQLQPGEGAVIADGVRQVAVARDHDGTLRAFNAVCPHLKCIVRYNPVASTFDCPCHGSRFAADGSVTEGPSLGRLEPTEPPA